MNNEINNEKNDELNRDREIAGNINYEQLYEINDHIAKTFTKIEELKRRKAELQTDAGEDTETELATIDKDLRDEVAHLASLKGDKRATLGYMD